MKKFIITIFLFTNLFSQNIELTKEEQNFINNTNLRVSITTNWQPFSFTEKEQPLGISYEYWKLIVEKLDLKTQNIFFNNFNKQLESLKNKESDIIFSVGETISRKEYAVFSNKYLSFPISIVTQKDENFIENIEQIINKKIAVGNNFTAHNLLKQNYPNLDLILVDSIKDGLELVSKNKAFAFIDIKPTLSYSIAKYGFNDLKISGNSGINFELKFMVRDDYIQLIPILNKAINSISTEEITNITSRWGNVQFETKFDYETITYIFIPILLIIIGFLYRNYELKKINKSLKLLVEEKTKSLNQINLNLEDLVEKKSKEIIQKENLLNHQSKMAAMGEMLENIAHQWRQPLSIISTVATSLKLKKDMNILEDKDFFESIESINNSSQHLSSTIDDFRNFFSKEKEVDEFFISNTIKKAINLLKINLDKYNITIIKEIEDIKVLNYENELIQVILNIISNSIDSLQEEDINNRFIKITTYVSNNNLIITINDNGSGIKDEFLDRIFEPYFTTKHKSQGTGIGLYMSLEIVTKHLQGNIVVSNTETSFNDKLLKGAKCEITIPLNIS
ncbi:ATP-binding protein [Aliarcobacter vitoriensis]|uniref:ATP-binding protein n=1 Tax=Aliarcobacter vitoriensis TaxID=2011099 RepID=UPI003AAF1CB1